MIQKRNWFLQAKLKEYDVELSLVESWEKGGEGATDLAKKVVDLADRESQLKYAYQLDNDVKSKIKDIATKIYGASDVIYSEEANSKINQIEKWDIQIYLFVLLKLNIRFQMIQRI